MTAVNWTDPSEGHVSDPKPALELINNKGGALTATSRGIAIFAMAPHSIAVAAGNRTGLGPAVGGAAIQDPAASTNFGGTGVLGVTDRFAATGVLGVAFHERSVGVRGEAENSGVGVVGVGSTAGVEGSSKKGNGVTGTTTSLGDEAGVFGQAQGDGGAGVRGKAVAGPGVEASSVAGPGVHATSDQAHGVIGEAKASNAVGVLGRNDASSGVGVDGYSGNGTAVRATSSKGKAIDASTFSGTAVHVNSASGIGIDCYAGGGPAVKAMSFGGTAIEAGAVSKGVSATVFGGSSAAPGVAVEGILLASGDAVKGTVAFNGAGIHGTGYSKLGCWAGLFDGDVSIKGILYKYASLFSIDHPLDPERRTLNHAAVEGPEYKTFYDGVATLGRDGRATVRLPVWFAALNGEPRHQLTAMGAPAPDLHVRSMKRDSFVIAGGSPGMKVCWQVTGVRRDAWARANPLQVETRKRRPTPSEGPSGVAELERLHDSIQKRLAEERAKAASASTASRRRVRAASNPARLAGKKRETGAGGASAATLAQARALVQTARRALKS